MKFEGLIKNQIIMRNETLLFRTGNKIAGFIEKYVTRADVDNREEVLALFDNMQRLFPQWVIGTCPMLHPEIQYLSKNGPVVFGYSNDLLIKHSYSGKFLDFVYEPDQKDLRDCIISSHDDLLTISPAEHHTYRMVYHYRFQKENGQVVYLHDEKAVIHLRDAENLYYSLFRDVTDEKTFNGVKVEIFRQQETLKKIKEYKPTAARNPLSKREKQLVTLIRQGLSTKEMAWHLNISHHTVRNIKSKLFEKYNVNNSIELLNMAGAN